MENELVIGNQIWMNRNLNVKSFNNGDLLTESYSAQDWKYAFDHKIPTFCNYNFDLELGKIYGKLYNWYAVIDDRNIAPKGWHIPSNDDWLELTNNIGGEKVAGYKLKNCDGWPKSKLFGINHNGSNEFGFSVIPGGYLSNKGAFEFEQIGNITVFWTNSQPLDTNSALTKTFKNANFWGKSDNYIHTQLSIIENGFYIRCFKKNTD